MAATKSFHRHSVAGSSHDAVAVNDIPVNFKSTLPPRKRAKTKEEKEQRRIERILRNRRAAHQSREKKRLHLQHLERKAALLEEILSSPDVAQLVKNDSSLRSIFDEYQVLASQADEDGSFAVHESPDSATNGQRTPESMSYSLSSSSKLTSRSNSLVSSPLRVVDEDKTRNAQQPRAMDNLLEPVPESPTVASVSFDSLLSGDLGENKSLCLLPPRTSVADPNNWNLLLTDNHDELVAHSHDEGEYPVLDMTDNSWGLDPLRNPAVIKLIR
ncbi:LAME_0A07206g1_1 [Lachancea meyersii CBS 8951]|uniref:LAME_0A07206g1_1 n=1 Tax=Lachancea meyersii CBS 8951 TaxID=1266667 RepID=A0A1G4IQS3_9SACH|nr:LAME_0A07206g1_1 [Lachancea meyersii CBS 8951]